MRLFQEENNDLKKKANTHKEVILKVSESLWGDLEKKEEVQGAWKEIKKLKKEKKKKG